MDPDRLDAVFKAYDIRGLVPDQLDADLCAAVGAAFAAFVAEADGADRVLVARDMRPTGLELVDAFAEGVTSQGLDVVDLGLGSTDLLYFAAGRLDAPGAMFTASHNPADYNGIKLCLLGRPAGRRGHRAGRHPADGAEAGVPPAATTGGAARRRTCSTALRRPRALVRRRRARCAR